MNQKTTGRLLVISYISYAAVYLVRLNFSAATPFIKEAGYMTEAQIGMISSIFLIVYAIGRLINGAICDRVAPRSIFMLGTFTFGLCNLLLGFLPPFPLFCLLWAVNGYAQSLLWGSLLRTVCANVSEKRRPFVLSIMGTSLCLGNIAGLLLAFYAAEHLGLGLVFTLPGLISVGISVITFLFFKGDRSEAKVSAWLPNLSLLKLPSVRKMVLPALLHGVLKDNLNLWMALYFAVAFGIDTGKVQFFVYAIPLTAFLGRLIYPTLFRQLGANENKVSAAALAMCILTLIPLALGKASAIVAAVLLCVFSASIQVINNSVLAIFPSRYNESGQSSQVAGWMDFFTYLGAGIGAKVYGLIVTDSRGFRIMYLSWILIAAGILVLLSAGRGKKKHKAL